MEDVKALIFRILEILKISNYDIPAHCLQYMEFLAGHMTVYQVNSTPEVQTIDLFDYQQCLVGNISIRSVAQTIDVPPIFSDGEQINIAPTLVLPEKADKRTILHEICHLLSIGPYIQSEEYFLYHRFGICEFSYDSYDGQTESHMLNGHEGINELLTDYVAWHFMNLLYGEILPFYSGTERFGKYLDTLWKNDMTVEKLVGWYFSGKTINISEFLLDNRYKNYRFLYIAVYEFRIGPVDKEKAAIIDELYGSVPDSGLTLEETQAERRNKQ